ncbi:glycosyltransferase [Paenarthrobacter sp. NPDC018779]|uniref:glycosyltransferase n=1 Tax=Paenarthrobacter sp. NPDC018779 TaxID=3364375 RepID=UPI0037CBE322
MTGHEGRQGAGNHAGLGSQRDTGSRPNLGSQRDTGSRPNLGSQRDVGRHPNLGRQGAGNHAGKGSQPDLDSRGNEPCPAAIRHVAVIVPAHNEEQRLGHALGSLLRAVQGLEQHFPAVTTSIFVVLDSCTDRSARIAASFAAAHPILSAIDVKLRSTGASRATGVASALEAGTQDPKGVWLANTDADSTVPADWLVRQVALANAGADAILGSVEPDPADSDAAVLLRWQELHPFKESHPHIYGANLGVRASAYLQSGGFPAVRAHEDRMLVERLRRHGFRVQATDSIRVTTSGRTHARAPQGFAAYLRALAQDVPVIAESA